MTNAFEATQPTGISIDPLKILLEASALLLTSADRNQIVFGIVDLASRVLAADAYAVWLDTTGEGNWRAVATRGLSEAYRTSIDVTPTVPLRTIQAVEDVTSDPSLVEYLKVYREERVCSLLVAPITLQSKKQGTITFYWHEPQRFNAVVLEHAEALANVASAALNTIELSEQGQLERRRLSFLAEASLILASSLDYETTLNEVAYLAVPEIADWCTVHIVEGGAVTRIVVAHADPDMLRMAEHFSQSYPEEIRQDRGIGAVLRTGKSEVYPYITDEMLRLAAKDSAHLDAMLALKITSSMTIPLTARGTVLGAMRFLAAGSNRHFSGDDVRLAEDLARRAATAIENARLHREVLRQEGELRLAHAAARMGSWSWDLATQLISWSKEFKTLHGLPPDAEPSTEAGRSLVHPDDRERILRELADALESPTEQLTSEHRVITEDGRLLWLQSRASIQRDGSGKPLSIFGITLDVTESHLAEEALRRTEKLAAAGRLAATVAHEINNPLEALTNLIYLASRAPGVPPEARGHLETADGELNRMAHVVRQTLGFYRESVNPQPADLGRLVAEVVQLYASRAATRGIHLSHSSDEDLITIVNGGEIKQVLSNLISNAIDASAFGGFVKTSVRRSAEWIDIHVVDGGEGISESNQARLFEAFFTTKADVGTGLGLWVSKGIIEKHGGTISVTSSITPGASGTRFTVCLPVAVVQGIAN